MEQVAVGHGAELARNLDLRELARGASTGAAAADGAPRARGVALHQSFGSIVAQVAEVSLDRKTGKIKVHNYWTAVDPGLVIQPESVLGQLEGATVYGLSVALLEELTIKGGAVQQSNFNDYPVLRMADMPEIHTRIVRSDAAPTGMGEIGVGPVAPAIANAVAQLTGKRLRELPQFMGTPIVMITSRASDKHRALAEEAGVDMYLTKPYTDATLIEHVKRLTSQDASALLA